MERTPPQQSQSPRREEPQRRDAPPPEPQKDDAELDRELEQTFPASDPVPPKHVD